MVVDSRQQEALETIAKYFKTDIDAARADASVLPIVEWSEKKFFIPETGRPIKLEPVQKCFLRYAYASDATTWVYSTIKKSGKTAISGLVGRYTAENSGPKAEVYFVANDKEQAKDRAHEAAKTSIELTPGFDRGKRILKGHWKIVERACTHESTGSKMQAIASDYEGAAGSNPTMTLWTELWGMTSERMKRLWDEMTPVPTRKRSVRYVETYAGFEGESELLLDLYKVSVQQGIQLTKAELEAVCGEGCWPYDDDPPFYVNKAARTFAYWDTGVNARRMPWQRGPEAEAYYAEQESTLRPEAYERLHLNHWVSATQQFIPLEWWHACRLPAVITCERNLACVLGVDASVSGDCTAIVGVSRYPKAPETEVLVRPGLSRVFIPPSNGTIDYQEVKETIKELCTNNNVVQAAYDVFQLHMLMQELTREAVVWCKQFSQAGDREIADKQLYDMIRDRKIHHYDEFEQRFVSNAAAYVALTAQSGKQTNKIDRLRIVKKGKDYPVDPVVALSMAVSEAMRLML